MKEISLANKISELQQIQEISKNQSIITLLIQALQSNDQEIQNYIFQQNDPELLKNTISQLDGKNTILLLNTLISKLDSNYKQSNALILWFKILIQTHSSILIQTPNIGQKLLPLYDLIRGKTRVLFQMKNLHQKIKQIKFQKKDESQHMLKPQIVYIDQIDQMIINDQQSQNDIEQEDFDDEFTNSEEKIEEEFQQATEIFKENQINQQGEYEPSDEDYLEF